MHEDRTALAGDRRIVVIPQRHYDVVKRIQPVKRLVSSGVGQYDPLVVGRFGWIVAPAIMWPDGRDWEVCLGAHHAILPVQDFAQRKSSGRRSAITFSFVLTHAAVSERATNNTVSHDKEATRIYLNVHIGLDRCSDYIVKSSESG